QIIAIGVDEHFVLREMRSSNYERRAIVVWAFLNFYDDFYLREAIDELIKRLIDSSRRRVGRLVLAPKRIGVLACNDDESFETRIVKLFDYELYGSFVYDRQKLFGIAQRDWQHAGSRAGRCNHSCFNLHPRSLAFFRIWLFSQLTIGNPAAQVKWLLSFC